MSKYYCLECERIVGSGFFAGHDRYCRRTRGEILVLPGETLEQVRRRSDGIHRHSIAMLIAGVVGGFCGYSQTRESIGAIVGAVIGVWIGSTKLGSQLILLIAAIAILAILVVLWPYKYVVTAVTSPHGAVVSEALRGTEPARPG
ncbi:MAG: hypothetical protein KIS79_03865 [Burkholderiales bacterium]|nr:hypothetical protein [Burkholderiales bacterium]